MDKQVNPINIQGIVRNRTKNTVDDGQSEDLINLRFKDNSWRTSGDGKLVFTMGHRRAGVPYVSQSYHNIYVHTNVYRHVLGIGDSGTADEGWLTWFADIDADGVFAGRNTPEHICHIGTTDRITVTQTGNLLTIISDSGAVSYALFNGRDGVYKSTTIDENGEPNARTLYPYGDVHFNLDCEDDNARKVIRVENDAKVVLYDYNKFSSNSTGILEPIVWHADMLEAYKLAREKNIFTRPFLAMVAVKLYDGKYAFASAPTLLWAREAIAGGGITNGVRTAYSPVSRYGINDEKPDAIDDKHRFRYQPCVFYPSSGDYNSGDVIPNETAHFLNDERTNITPAYNLPYPINTYPVYSSGLARASVDIQKELFGGGGVTAVRVTELHGADILLSLDDVSIIKDNPDLFTGIAVFITPEIDIYEQNDSELGELFYMAKYDCAHVSYSPKKRNIKNIRHDLLNSPFFLLREYDVKELDALQNNLRVDLTDPLYDAVLADITQQPRFEGNAVERKTVKPKVAYTYNGRLHLANYETSSFYGYPMEHFLYNNHSGLTQHNAKDIGLKHFKESVPEQINDPLEIWNGATIGTVVFPFTNLPTYQFPKNRYNFIDRTIPNYRQYLQYIPCWVAVNVYSTELGASVTRYIEATDTSGRQYIEDFPPILSFPDNRYDRMEIIIHRLEKVNDGIVNGPAVCEYRHVFKLQPHQYLNIAYYMSDDLKPIAACDAKSLWWTYDCANAPWSDILSPATINNATEHFPNGLKVSSTDNPLSFPYKNTYQVGSAEIVAMCSNAIAVGTGQTGEAPLFVFAKDGIYALIVDASGQMTYTNARIIARDVCNNHRSVTPIDAGVVFTTDRGLMMIAGNQVEELSEAVQGEPLHYADTAAATGTFTPLTAPHNIISLISNLPASINDPTDFLIYIGNAIINYNHNLRELIVSRTPVRVRDLDIATETDMGMGRAITAQIESEPYSYILDRYGNWKRYSFTADEYVNNYPTSYRVINGMWYKVDEEQDSINDEADNRFFVCSRAIKLNTLGFKQALRLIVRGFFHTQTKSPAEVRESSSETLPTDQTLTVTTIPTESGGSTGAQDPNTSVPGPTKEESAASQQVHLSDLLVSDVQTFDIQDGYEGDITVTFPQNGGLAVTPLAGFHQRYPAGENLDILGDSDWHHYPLAPSGYSAELDLTQNNTCVIAYQLIDSNGGIVQEWIMPTEITESGITADFSMDEQRVHINKAGTYSLRLFVKTLDLYMTTDRGNNILGGTASYEKDNVYPAELTVSAMSETDTTTIDTPVELSLDEPTSIFIPPFVVNPRLALTYKGYVDFVCDPQHENTEDKVCHFDPDYANTASLLVLLKDYEEENTFLNRTVESVESIGDHTLRVHLNGTDTVPLPDTPEESATYKLSLFLKSLSAKMICDVPATTDERLQLIAGSINSHFVAYQNPRFVLIDNSNLNILDSTAVTEIRYELHIKSNDNQPLSDYTAYETELQALQAPALIIKKVGVPDETVLSIPPDIDHGVESVSSSIDENDKYIKVYQRRFFWGDRTLYDANNNDITKIQSKTIQLGEYLEEGEEYFYEVSSASGYSHDASWAIETNSEVSRRITDYHFIYRYEQEQYPLAAVFPQDNPLTVGVSMIYDLLPLFSHSRIFTESSISNLNSTNKPAEVSYIPGSAITSHVGVYVFGSYDGRKWTLLGGKEKTGRFTDIGCLVERTDVRYLRYIIAGNVKGESRIDHIELETEQSKLLNQKTR